MPSFTFSSDSRALKKPWFLVMSYGLVLAAVLILFLEIAFRSLGFPCSVADSPLLWSKARLEASSTSPGSVTLIGTSRTLIDFNYQGLKSSWPSEKIIQLAIVGGSPIPVLAHLAADDSFRGLVICELSPPYVFDALGAGDTTPTLFIDKYEQTKVSWSMPLEVFARNLAQTHLVVLSSTVRPENILRYIQKRSVGKQWMDSKRFVHNYITTKIAGLNHKLRDGFAENMANRGRPMTKSELKKFRENILEYVRKIEERKGRVIFWRPPVSGKVQAAEEKRFSREQYWDFIADSPELTTIHWLDEDSLKNFSCPDGSHIDSPSTYAFSRHFAEVVKKTLKKKTTKHSAASAL